MYEICAGVLRAAESDASSMKMQSRQIFGTAGTGK